MREAQKDNEELEQIHTLVSSSSKAFSMGLSSSNDHNDDVVNLRAQKALRFNDCINHGKDAIEPLNINLTENEQSEGLTDHDGLISSSAPSSPDCKRKDTKEVSISSSHKTLPVRSITKQKKNLSSLSSTSTTTTRMEYVASSRTQEIKKVVGEIDDMIAQRRAGNILIYFIYFNYLIYIIC